MSLTPKQKEILDFIESFAAKNGYAPSQQEIAQHFGFRSLGTVQNYLVRLQRNGFLKRTWNAKRATQVVGMPAGGVTTTPPTPPRLPNTPESASVPLPLLGRVAAGRPIEAVLHQETLDIPITMLRGPAQSHFVLQVKGDSMRDDGILDGDFVVIRKASEAKNGQTVVALLNHEATLKRFFRSADRIELRPANSAYAPMVVRTGAHADPSLEFRIEGICTGLIRKLDEFFS
jgi:repressor LexA